jgi:hypothetical protein
MPVPLAAFDPDFPFDTLSFTIERAPLHGGLVGEAPNLSYLPDRDFVGIDSLEFRASDGVFESEPAVVTIEVLDANVPPTLVGPGEELRAGLGYPVRVDASLSDPNQGDTQIASIDWGDGFVEDSVSGSVELVQGGGEGALVGQHVYATTGVFPLLICAEDDVSISPPRFLVCAFPRTDVIVEPMADLEVAIFDSNPLTPIGGRLEYLIRVEHVPPDASITPGIPAQDVSVDITLPPGLVFDALPGGGSCQQSPLEADGTQSASCSLPPLAPGGEALLPLALRALVADTDAFTVEVSSTTADPRAPNLALVFPSLESGRSVVLGGVAEGDALVTIVLEGQAISLFSIAGETAAALLARLATEIREDAVLAGLGVSAQAFGSRLATSVPIESFTSEDAGLFAGSFVGFSGARLAIDLDFLGRFEIGPASGTVVMSPTGRIAMVPGALGARSELIPQPPESDPFTELSFLGASHDAGLFEPDDEGDVVGRMPLAGSLAVEIAGAADLFVRSLSQVGAGVFEPPNPGFGLDVQLSSGAWTTGSIEVQGYSEGEGFLPVETFSGLDAREESLDLGSLRFVTPLLLDLRDDGLVERVPGFAELTIELVPEPSAGLGGAAALLTLGWLSRRRRLRRGFSPPSRTRRRARRPPREAAGSRAGGG